MKKAQLLIFICLIIFLSNSNTKLYAQDVDLYLNNLNVYVSEYGRVALFSLPDTVRQVYRTALLVGTGPDAVFDLTYDLDVEETTTLLTNQSFGDYEIYGSYNNEYSGASPNVLEKENIYCWQNQNSIIIKYTVLNRETELIDAIIGWEFLPRIDNNRSGGDTVTYTLINNVITVKNKKAVGFKTLSENLKSLGSSYYYTDYESDSLFWSWLSYSSIDSLFISDPNYIKVDAPTIIPSLNSKSLAPGDSLVVYIALAYGETEEAMLASLAQAQEKYNLLTDLKSDMKNIPSSYSLNQNYPNPFNPSTTISFGLPEKSEVTLKIYNMLGEEVAQILNQTLDAGNHSIDFDASLLSSGMYVYSLQTKNQFITKKMSLIK